MERIPLNRSIILLDHQITGIGSLIPLYGANSPSSDFTGNLISNGDMSGTSGTLSTGSEGDVATSFTVEDIGTDTDTTWRVFSKTAGDAQNIVFDVPSGNGAVGLVLSQLASGWSVGKTYYAEVEIDVQSVTGSVEKLRLEARQEGGPSDIYRMGMYNFYAGDMFATGKGLIRTPTFVVDAATTDVRFRFKIEGDSSAAAVGTTVVITAARLVEV